MIYSLKVVYTR